METTRQNTPRTEQLMAKLAPGIILKRMEGNIGQITPIKKNLLPALRLMVKATQSAKLFTSMATTRCTLRVSYLTWT